MQPSQSLVNNLISTAFIAAPRHEMFLGFTLFTYFENANFSRPFIFCEPGTPNFQHQDQVNRIDNPKQFTIFWNWVNAARYMLKNTSTPYIMMCEDDVFFKEAFNKVLDVLDKKKVVAGWTPEVCRHNNKGWGNGTLNIYGWCGSLCFIFPREVLSEVLFHIHMQNTENDRNLDTRIGSALRELSIPILAHVPSLVSHLGHTYSTLNPIGDNHLDNAARLECFI